MAHELELDTHPFFYYIIMVFLLALFGYLETGGIGKWKRKETSKSCVVVINYSFFFVPDEPKAIERKET